MGYCIAGYGHSTPTTIGGKTFCMFYALAGIPLGLVMFQSIGERINTFAAMLLKCCRRCAGRPTKVTHIDLILIASGCGSFLIASGAYVFHRYEKWTYFDSLYYCFTTLTTIGFGDFVALQKDGALQSTPEYVVFALVFILFGLTVISAAMNLLVLRFLTMNTEDEKRDEQEAQLAARGLVRMNPLDRSKPASSRPLLMSRPYSPDSESYAEFEQERANRGGADAETSSVCSCSCYQLPYSESGIRKRYVRVPNTINALVRISLLLLTPTSEPSNERPAYGSR
ncbi:unnamed protein product [Toxocara canis]|uniref:Two pore potassium channel protein sup-9 n=1 Tax=Toxocara canis TaxID=6265 RepID=A0A183UQ39_TOXCA|nr:unnamed protein product [Toxocara canis]